MKRIITLLCLWAAYSLLHAQTAASAPPALPPGPLVQTRAPDNAKWVVTKKVGNLNDPVVKNESSSSEQGSFQPDATEDTIIKTGEIIHVVRVTGSKTWNIWCKGAQQFLIWPDGETCAPLTKAPNPDAPNPFYIDFSVSDFPGFQWVKIEDYSGFITYANTKCIVFREKPAGQDDVAENIAYIDLETRLPIALQSGGREFLYTWKPAPSEELSLPSVVRENLDASIKVSGK